MPSTKTSDEAVDRSLVLGILAFRARFEGTRHSLRPAFDPSDAQAMVAGVTAWVREAGLGGALLDAELAALEMPPMTWSRDLTVAIQGAALEESIGALLFALQVVPNLPAYDREIDN